MEARRSAVLYRPAIFFFTVFLLTSTQCLGEDHTWTVSSSEDFHDGVMDDTDSWSTEGSVQLDKSWRAAGRVNSIASESRDLPRLTSKISGPNTTFFCVWEDERVQDHYPDIRFKAFNFITSSWSGEVEIRSHVNDVRQKSPDITVRSSNDDLWVIWQEDSGSGSNDGDIYHAISSDNGANWSTPSAVYSGTGNQVTPRICADRSTISPLLYATWEDQRSDSGDIYVSRFSTSWSTPFKISDGNNSNQQRTPDIACDAGGNVYVVWHDYRDNDDGETYFSMFSSGSTWQASSWSANSRLSDDSVEYALASPSITTGPDNIVYTAWAERVSTGPATYDFQIRAAKSEDQGSSWESSVVDRLDGASSGNNSYEVPAIGLDSSGRVHVSWMYDIGQQASDGYMLHSLSANKGSNWIEPENISGSSQNVKSSTIPALEVSDNDHVLVAWDDYRNVSPDIFSTSYPGLLHVPTGTYSKTLETEGLARWGVISWSATLPAATTVTIESRVRNSTDDAWGNWLSHSVSGDDVSHDAARYFQFRATLNTSNPNTTPTLDEFSLTYQTMSWPIFMPAVVSGGQSEE